MSTAPLDSNLSTALFGRTRRAILAQLYGHPDEAYYLRQLVRSSGLGLGAVQREVARLAGAGIIQRTARGRQVYYQANPQCPLFAELKSLVVKTAGVGDVLRQALAPLAARITVAFIYGSVARTEQRSSSDADLMVIGAVGFGEVVSALEKAQKTLGREINPTVFSAAEFRSKIKVQHHFLTSVQNGEKVFVIGDEDEFDRLGLIRMAREPLRMARRVVHNRGE
jgi:predicted nucleotidyltransferase